MSDFTSVKLTLSKDDQIETSISGFKGNETTAYLLSESQFAEFDRALHSFADEEYTAVTQFIKLTPEEPSKIILAPDGGTWHVVFVNCEAYFVRARKIAT